MSLGERIRELRTIKDVSRSDLAKYMGISYWALAKYELNDRTPDNELIKRFANYFEVSIDYLLGNTEIKPVADAYVEEEVKRYDEKVKLIEGFIPKVILKLDYDYLKLALEMQRDKVNPDKIRKIIIALRDPDEE